MTLAEARGLIRLTLASAERWPDESLDAWMAAAIRLYGAHFGERTLPETDDEPLDVPETHIEALTAYVDFAALRQMQVAESLATDGSSILLGQLSDQARRAWSVYKDVMDQLLTVTSEASEAVSWGPFGL